MDIQLLGLTRSQNLTHGDVLFGFAIGTLMSILI